MNDEPEKRAEVHSVAGTTAEKMANLGSSLGWGNDCRILTPDEAVAALRNFDLLAEFDDAKLAEVGTLIYECNWRADTVIFHEKEAARHFFLLVAGQIALEKDIRLGPHSPPRRAPIEFLGPGSALGWSSLVPPFQYSKTAVVTQPTRAFCIDGQAFRDWMLRNPLLGVGVMSQIAALVASRLAHQTSMLLYFLSIVSHELRAPLAAVENYLQVMLSGYAGPINQEQQTMLERSVLRLGEMSELITGVLDLARMQQAQIRQAFEPVDLQDVITEAIEDVQLRMKQRGLELVQEVPQPPPKLVAAHGQLRQALSNVLSNAIKFSREGSTIRLLVKGQGDTLSIEVIDHGIGIPRDELDHIFEAFYRGRGTAETAGLGLGLSIAKRVIDAHRGRIWAESPYPPGGSGGSRFVVELPVNPADET